jgi:hypothetical protein
MVDEEIVFQSLPGLCAKIGCIRLPALLCTTKKLRLPKTIGEWINCYKTIVYMNLIGFSDWPQRW